MTLLLDNIKQGMHHAMMNKFYGHTFGIYSKEDTQYSTWQTNLKGKHLCCMKKETTSCSSPLQILFNTCTIISSIINGRKIDFVYL